MPDCDVLSAASGRSGSCSRCCSTTSACGRSPSTRRASRTTCRARRSSTTRCCGSSSPPASTRRSCATRRSQRAVSFVDRARQVDRGVPPGDGELGHPPLVSIHQPSMERTMVAALERARARRAALGHARRDRRPRRRPRDRLGAARRRRPRRASCARATWSAATAGAAPCAAACGSPSADRPSRSAGSWSTRSVDRPIAKAPHPHFVGDVTRPIVSLPMSPGRHRWEWMLHPGEDAGAVSRAGAHPRAARAVDHRRAGRGRARGRLHVPRAHAPSAGARGACSSPATPRT